MGFLLALNDAVRGKRLGDPMPDSHAIEAMLQVPPALPACCRCGSVPLRTSLSLLLGSAHRSSSLCARFTALPVATSGTMCLNEEH